MKQRGQRAAAQGGKRGRAKHSTGLRRTQDYRGYRRSGRRPGQSGAETQTSKQRRLARVKAAAEGSRREYRRQEGGRNSGRPWDFGARGLRRANGKSPMAERRTSVNRSPCGRRTSLGLAGLRARRPADSIPGWGKGFQSIS